MFGGGEDAGATPEDPTTDLCNRHSSNKIHRNIHPVRKCKLPLGTGSALGELIPIADQIVGLVENTIEVIGNDLADGLLKTRQIRAFPGTKAGHFFVTEILALVASWVVYRVAEGL